MLSTILQFYVFFKYIRISKENSVSRHFGMTSLAGPVNYYMMEPNTVFYITRPGKYVIVKYCYTLPYVTIVWLDNIDLYLSIFTGTNYIDVLAQYSIITSYLFGGMVICFFFQRNIYFYKTLLLVRYYT